MSTPQDCAVTLEQETVYKTYATPTRSLEYIDEDLDWDKNPKWGRGIKAGRRMARTKRRTVPSAQGKGSTTHELMSKGLGKLFDSGFGTSTVTLVGGTTYQHVFTFGDTPKSLSLQKQLVEVGGTIDPWTFLGAMVAQMDFSFPNQDDATVKFTYDIGDFTSAQASASLVYPTTPTLYSFNNWTISTGALTAPTATALASMATPIATFRDAGVTINNNLKGDRFNGGGGGRKSKPTVGLRSGSGTATVEYADTTWRDAVLNDTQVPLLFQYTGAALSTGVETVQLVIADARFNTEFAKTKGTDLINQSMAFEFGDDEVAASPVWLVVRTSDATL